MERLFAFWRNCSPIPKDARELIEQHAKVMNFHKNDYYIESIEVQHHWCFVPQGLVAGIHRNLSGKEATEWIVEENNYFTGTRHPFTYKTDGTQIKFLQDTKIIEIPISIIQHAQKEHLAVSELLHALKQKKMNQNQKRIRMFLEDNKNLAYAYFRDHFPGLAEQLTVQQVCRYIGISETTYRRAKKIYEVENPRFF